MVKIKLFKWFQPSERRRSSSNSAQHHEKRSEAQPENLPSFEPDDERGLNQDRKRVLEPRNAQVQQISFQDQSNGAFLKGLSPRTQSSSRSFSLPAQCGSSSASNSIAACGAPSRRRRQGGQGDSPPLSRSNSARSNLNPITMTTLCGTSSPRTIKSKEPTIEEIPTTAVDIAEDERTSRTSSKIHSELTTSSGTDTAPVTASRRSSSRKSSTGTPTFIDRTSSTSSSSRSSTMSSGYHHSKSIHLTMTSTISSCSPSASTSTGTLTSTSSASSISAASSLTQFGMKLSTRLDPQGKTRRRLYRTSSNQELSSAENTTTVQRTWKKKKVFGIGDGDDSTETSTVEDSDVEEEGQGTAAVASSPSICSTHRHSSPPLSATSTRSCSRSLSHSRKVKTISLPSDHSCETWDHFDEASSNFGAAAVTAAGTTATQRGSPSSSTILPPASSPGARNRPPPSRRHSDDPFQYSIVPSSPAHHHHHQHHHRRFRPISAEFEPLSIQSPPPSPTFSFTSPLSRRSSSTSSSIIIGAIDIPRRRSSIDQSFWSSSSPTSPTSPNSFSSSTSHSMIGAGAGAGFFSRRPSLRIISRSRKYSFDSSTPPSIASSPPTTISSIKIIPRRSLSSKSIKRVRRPSLGVSSSANLNPVGAGNPGLPLMSPVTRSRTASDDRDDVRQNFWARTKGEPLEIVESAFDTKNWSSNMIIQDRALQVGEDENEDRDTRGRKSLKVINPDSAPFRTPIRYSPLPSFDPHQFTTYPIRSSPSPSPLLTTMTTTTQLGVAI